MANPVTLALLGSGAISGVGNLLGGILGQDSGRQVKETPIAGGLDVNADPVVAQQRLDALIRLGVFDPNVLEQASPIRRIINNLSSGLVGDLRKKDLERLSIALNGIPGQIVGIADALENSRNMLPLYAEREIVAAYEGLPPDAKRIFDQVAGTSIQNLARSEVAFRQGLQERAPELQALAAEAGLGRRSAISSISQLQQDFPLATEEQLTRLTNEIQNERIRASQQDANYGRFRDEPLTETEAILQAASILGSRQGLAIQGIEGLGSSLALADAAATGATPAATGAVSLGQTALAQAAALAGLANPGNQALAGGVQGGINAVGNSIANAALLNALTKGGPGSNNLNNLTGQGLLSSNLTVPNAFGKTASISGLF